MREAVLVVAIACLLSSAAQSQSTADRDAISKVRALENLWNQAEEKGDARALDLIFDSSMIYVNEDGALLNKTQILNRIAKENSTGGLRLFTPTMNVHLYGDTAVAVGTYRVKTIREGKLHQWTGQFIDTWAFKNGTWQCIAAQSTRNAH
jgi:ketosteroid isomerase-like protein